MERDILNKARAWFPGSADRLAAGIRVRKRGPGLFSDILSDPPCRRDERAIDPESLFGIC